MSIGRLVRKNDKARLVLSVDLIGQAVSVEVDAADVRAVLTSMKIGSIDLPSPFVVAPMAGMTDTAFRRLVKRHGGCGLVVTEMVSSEGLVRGIDRTLEYAEYTEEERPVSIQIFGGEPPKMAAAARIVQGHGRRHRRCQHGLPGAEDRQAQCRLQSDARTRPRRARQSKRWWVPSTFR